MRKLSICRIAMAALVFVCGVACSGSTHSDELTALDKAYASGVLTADEYAAKKATLLAASTPAASGPASSTQAASSPPQPAAAKTPAPTDGHTYQMKMAKIMDQSGFERPMVSATMLIPLDWQARGSTTWNIKDGCNTIQTSLQVSGPDGRAFEVFPAYAWNWADDPTALRQSFAQQAQFGMHSCEVEPPVSAADYVKGIAGKVRPNAQIVAMEQAPKLLEILRQQASQTEQTAAQYGLRQMVRPDAVRARLKYVLNGKPVEEWLVVATIVTGTLGPGFNPRTMQMTQAYSYNCTATMVAERAPQGQLDSSEKFFDLIGSTYHANAEWQSRVAGNAQAIQQIQLVGVQNRSDIVTKTGEDIANIQRQGFENQQRVQDQSSAQFGQVIRGVESYRNPGTGETVELDSNYGHAWVSNTGVYLLSDREGLDPNTVSKESWTPLQHVKP